MWSSNQIMCISCDSRMRPSPCRTSLLLQAPLGHCHHVIETPRRARSTAGKVSPRSDVKNRSSPLYSQHSPSPSLIILARDCSATLQGALVCFCALTCLTTLRSPGRPIERSLCTGHPVSCRGNHIYSRQELLADAHLLGHLLTGVRNSARS
jgi:hypothetical protein